MTSLALVNFRQHCYASHRTKMRYLLHVIPCCPTDLKILVCLENMWGFYLPLFSSLSHVRGYENYVLGMQWVNGLHPIISNICFISQATTVLGGNIQNLELNENNISEVLRLFILCRNEGRPHSLSDALLYHPLLALSPINKAAVLAFLCHELLCGKSIGR